MPKGQKIITWISRFFLGAILLYVLCLAGIYLFLQCDPDQLVESWLGRIEAETGLKFEIGSIDVSLLPLPAMAISDVRIKGKDLLISVAWLEARPTFASLLGGNLFPGVVQVLRPKLEWQTDFPLAKPDKWPKFKQGSANSDWLAMLPGKLEMNISQLEAQIIGSDAYGLTVAGFNSELTLRKTGAVAGKLQLGSMRLSYERKNVASLDNCLVEGKSHLFAFFTKTDNLRLQGNAQWANVIKKTSFGCDLESFSQGISGRGRIAGDLDLEGEAVPFSLMGWIGRLEQGQEIVARGLDWQLGPDSGSLDLSLLLPKNLADFQLAGKLMANRISLTQWLGFARNLAPGLQLALDNITKASLDFSLNAKSLTVPRIVATCCGATFYGKGGVKDWQKPVVALNLNSDKVNLGLGLPESVGEMPDPPFYPHPTLTPMPGTPLEPGEVGIGYDIRLGAKLLRYGPLKIQNAFLRIYPGKMDKSGLEDVLLDARAKFYGGTVIGSCILGAHPSLPIHITARAANINGAPLGKDMPLIPIRQGKWESRATVASRGKHLKPFLANLKGNIATTGKNGALAPTGSKNIFNYIHSSVQLKTSSWNGRNLVMDGSWKGEIKDDQLDSKADVKGRISFGKDGMILRQLPGTVSGRLPQLPHGLQNFKITGSFTAQSDKNRFEASNAHLHIAGLDLRGHCVVDAGKETAQGELKTEVGQLGTVLEKLGYGKVKIPSAFTPVSLATQFSAKQHNLKLTKINASLGQHRLSGSFGIHLPNRQKPRLELDLALNRLALDDFGSKTPNSSPWDYPWLNQFDASGNIKINDLNIYGLHIRSLRFPLKLTAGNLVASDISASFYGAPLQASINVHFQKGVAFTSKLKINNFNLEEAAKALKIKAVLKGQASLETSANAKLAGSARLMPALNGSWNFAVKNGSWQAVKKNGEATGKATYFRSSDAAGTVIGGVIKTANFKLKSPDLNVTGGGWLNLVTEQMDCNFNVSMKGLPDFPLRLYGSLNNSKTSIGAGKMLMNAVGEVTSGFVGAVGGMFKGVWHIFRK